MESSLSNVTNNLSEGIRRIKYKFGHDDKNVKNFGVSFLENTNFKDDLTECKCLCYNKNYQHKFDKKLKERFLNTCKFSNLDNNKFILLLQKGIILINLWMIGKTLVKHHYLKKKSFTVT